MSDAHRTDWPFVELDVPAEAADALGSALVDLGSNGIEQRDQPDGIVRLVAYFSTMPELTELAAGLAHASGVDRDVARAAASDIRAGSTPDDDWLRIWKRGFEPTPVGERLLVYPSWRRDEARAMEGRVRLEVDPGMAFGTGTHETTRLCLEWLDTQWRGGSLLDVGTGTGILAIAAALLAPSAEIVAVDVDPVAIDVARANAAVNGVADRIALSTDGPDTVEGSFDVVLANLTADVILALDASLVERTRADGTLVLSGVLDTQADEVVASFVDLGLELLDCRSAGEWVSLALRRS